MPRQPPTAERLHMVAAVAAAKANDLAADVDSGLLEHYSVKRSGGFGKRKT